MTAGPARPERLSEVLQREGCLAPSRALAILARLVGALHDLHAAGRFHGLVAPHTVLLHPGDRPELADFGLAAHLAPEAGRPGPEADLYGLGLLLFEMLAGELPRPGETLARRCPDLPEAAHRLFLGCCTGRERRLPSLGALEAELLGRVPPSGREAESALLFLFAGAGDCPLPAAPARDPEPVLAAEIAAALQDALDRAERDLVESTAALRVLVPLAGLALAAAVFPWLSWGSLVFLPAALLLLLVAGDVRQKARFFGRTLAALEAFARERGAPPLALWRHVEARADRWPSVWIWMQYAEERFLPPELRSPPRRMGGVARVPWVEEPPRPKA